MQCNVIQITSANKVGGNKFRELMQVEPQPGTKGYISSFVEIFVVLMTMPAYEALWDLLYPAVNPYGWGHDFWYNGYGKKIVKGHKMGIVSSVEVQHEQGAGRTDSNSIRVKWNAVLAQERHYSQYRNVRLNEIRRNLDIVNGTWNGAAKGYLH